MLSFEKTIGLVPKLFLVEAVRQDVVVGQLATQTLRPGLQILNLIVSGVVDHLHAELLPNLGFKVEPSQTIYISKARKVSGIIVRNLSKHEKATFFDSIVYKESI